MTDNRSWLLAIVDWLLGVGACQRYPESEIGCLMTDNKRAKGALWKIEDE
jgi:hypothetical protein